MSISSRQASSARCWRPMTWPRWANRALSRPAVRLLLEPMPGPRGHVADRRDLERLVDLGQPHRLADQVVLDLVDRPGRLGLRVADPDRGLEPPVDRDVHVLIDRGAQDGPELVPVEGGQVGAAAREAHAIGGLRDDHRATIPSQTGCPVSSWTALRSRIKDCSRWPASGSRRLPAFDLAGALDQGGQLGRLDGAVVPLGHACGARRGPGAPGRGPGPARPRASPRPAPRPIPRGRASRRRRARPARGCPPRRC